MWTGGLGEDHDTQDRFCNSGGLSSVASKPCASRASSAVIEPTKPIPPPGVGLGLGSSGGLGLRKSRVELAYLVG